MHSVDPPPAYKLPKGRNWTKLTGETVIYQGSPRQWRFALIHTNAVRKHISAFGSSEIAKSASGRCDGVTCYEEFEYADGPVRRCSITNIQSHVLFVLADRLFTNASSLRSVDEYFIFGDHDQPTGSSSTC